MTIDLPSPMSANKNGFTTSNLALLEKHLAGCLPHTFLLGAPLTTFRSAPAGILADIVYIIQTTEHRQYTRESKKIQRGRNSEKIEEECLCTKPGAPRSAWNAAANRELASESWRLGELTCVKSGRRQGEVPLSQNLYSEAVPGGYFVPGMTRLTIPMASAESGS